MEKITLDLNDIAQGRVELASFKDKLTSLDLTPYKGKNVQLKGCAPTWAHLMVAAKLFPIAGALEFLVDDGQSGKPIPLK